MNEETLDEILELAETLKTLKARREDVIKDLRQVEKDLAECKQALVEAVKAAQDKAPLMKLSLEQRFPVGCKVECVDDSGSFDSRPEKWGVGKYLLEKGLIYTVVGYLEHEGENIQLRLAEVDFYTWRPERFELVEIPKANQSPVDKNEALPPLSVGSLVRCKSGFGFPEEGLTEGKLYRVTGIQRYSTSGYGVRLDEIDFWFGADRLELVKNEEKPSPAKVGSLVRSKIDRREHGSVDVEKGKLYRVGVVGAGGLELLLQGVNYWLPASDFELVEEGT